MNALLDRFKEGETWGGIGLVVLWFSLKPEGAAMGWMDLVVILAGIAAAVLPQGWKKNNDMP